MRGLMTVTIAGVVAACHASPAPAPDTGEQEKAAEFRGIALGPPSSAASVPHEAPSPQAVASKRDEGDEGYLNINSIPPSMCFVDGHAVGRTPRIHFSVKSGTHTVKFVTTEDGPTKSISVTVGAGETKAAAAKLD